jgi:hypothetical protein
MALDIIHHSDLSRFHTHHYPRNEPAVIRGLREHAPTKVFDWSAEHFKQRMGDKVVPVMATRTGFLSYERNFIDMPFGKFVDRMYAPDPESGLRYYFKNPTKLLPPEDDEQSPVPDLAVYTQKAVARNLWISSSGLTVGLHFDPADNLNFQLRGRKSFTLYPPGVRAFYPMPMFSQTAHISGVFRNGPNPDFREFPRFKPESGIRTELEEGDVLYIPAYWWHQVESLGHENLNLNFWWLPKLSKQLTNWNQALRGHAQVLLRLMKYGNIQQAPRDKHST